MLTESCNPDKCIKVQENKSIFPAKQSSLKGTPVNIIKNIAVNHVCHFLTEAYFGRTKNLGIKALLLGILVGRIENKKQK